tara:strand:- start:4391 stop:5092 length:702 start_codon:yes stop_codon:yes gene_type:complete
MKNTFKTYLVITTLALVIIACGGGGDDPPAAPVNVAPPQTQLIYPSANLLCIDNNIAFEWIATTDPDGDTVKYRLTIARDRNLNEIVEQRTSTSIKINIELEKAVAYYWSVTAMDSKGNEAEPTETLAFYTAGAGVSNYAPFTAALVSPDYDVNVNAGTISLDWAGGDTNTGDLLTYDLFFGETSDPPLIVSGLTTETSNVNLVSGKTYYWKVNTLDNFGAKTIGQIWKFNVN